MIQSSVNSSVVVACFDQLCQTLNKPTIVIIDNAPVHTRLEFPRILKSGNSKACLFTSYPLTLQHSILSKSYGNGSNTIGYPLKHFNPLTPYPKYPCQLWFQIPLPFYLNIYYTNSVSLQYIPQTAFTIYFWRWISADRISIKSK